MSRIPVAGYIILSLFSKSIFSILPSAIKQKPPPKTMGEQLKTEAVRLFIGKRDKVLIWFFTV
jgi:hypothetical protein